MRSFAHPPSIEASLVDLNESIRNTLIVATIINAADAIAEVVGESRRRGLIEVRSWAEGDSVVVTISDTGPGIAPEHADRVFDPFFTTKEVGRARARVWPFSAH